MVRKSAVAVAFLCLVGLLLSGCVSSTGGSTYSRDQTRTEISVREGVVTAVNEVKIEGTSGVVGAVTGGVTGGLLGRTIGKGTGKDVATAAGAVGGALAGAAVEKGVTKRNGWEITVKLDNGQTIAVVQEKEPAETFTVGDRVRVLKDANGVTR
ncbi:MAG TPA: glycine zipper 2TM domain-containing protein, partial [bacterium]|nr:glycine zipper 2TM domain-containing protein [bacterium]